MKEKILRHLSNIPGKSFKRKIVVLESDDWGSIRMPSKEVCDLLSKKGINVYENFFSANDGLESNEDLEHLFEVLNNVKDFNGNPAIMTPLVILANPDFKAIEDNGFSKYVYEPFTETAEAYKGSDKILKLWKEGWKQKVFHPEFHGREHVNVKRWMNGLQYNLPNTMFTFKLKLMGLHSSIANEKRKEYFPAFDIDTIEDLKYLEEVFEEGVSMFKNMLGYNPLYFVPPNGPFNTNLEPLLQSLGLKYINAAKIQDEPLGDNKFKKRFHYIGQKSKSGLIYLTRNVIFEPSQHQSKSWVTSALNDIGIAFKWNKPAVISSHRVNYVSRISNKNREHGLSQLNELLTKIVKKWPDVEFMSSAQLGSLYS